MVRSVELTDCSNQDVNILSEASLAPSVQLNKFQPVSPVPSFLHISTKISVFQLTGVPATSPGSTGSGSNLSPSCGGEGGPAVSPLSSSRAGSGMAGDPMAGQILSDSSHLAALSGKKTKIFPWTKIEKIFCVQVTPGWEAACQASAPGCIPAPTPARNRTLTPPSQWTTPPSTAPW